MTLPEDIASRIKADFQDHQNEAIKILQEAVLNYDFLNNDRIIRCIIFLSRQTLEGLINSINDAIQDPRDVMLWAEYTNLKEGQEPIRIKDFHKPFSNFNVNES
jgi:hypothetical protein